MPRSSASSPSDTAPIFRLRCRSSSAELSIGLCGADDDEFYAEHGLAQRLAHDDFLSNQVVPQLGAWPGLRGDMPSIAAALVLWLNGFAQDRLEVCYDFHADFEFVEQLLALSKVGLDVIVEP